ncbi:hypothetical protein C9374_010629 [Naegleria lovaniensis]|uniref:Rhodanese domain-containing protein n=1 Tax=Naegleria lovaniensis TaxID=51637 RepID=A0AA88GBE6_NAELO|nr:uncharacterized protein C9374_010629 [Naegleria lovaniensis]KAG2374610.1 hypothetical protein C9374_010629 [Naegleria lovaniensis]
MNLDRSAVTTTDSSSSSSVLHHTTLEQVKGRSKRASSNPLALSLKITVPEPSFKKIDVQTFASMIGKESVLIIDVRDEDYEGGHVKGSLHLDFSNFEQVHLPTLIKTCKEKSSSLDTIVFYCMYSEQRGPQCATSFAEKIADDKELQHLKLFVPSGGFNSFLKKYPAPNEYIDDYSAEFFYENEDGQLLHKIDAQYLDVITGEKQNFIHPHHKQE